MEIRPLSGPGPLIAALVAEAGLTTNAPGGVAAGAPDLLAGLNSPLAAAGLLAPTASAENAALPPAIAADNARASMADTSGFRTTMASTLDTPMTPLADGGRLGMPAPGMDAQATQPLAPAWITALHTPTLRQGPWPDAQAPVRQREHQRRQQDADETIDEIEQTAASDEPGTTAIERADDTHPTPWPLDTLAQLPAEVQAELARRRAVLLVAPPGPGQRGLQLVCLGFGMRGQPLLRRWAVRGADAATAGETRARAWHLWRVRREGDDGQRPVLNARALSARPMDVGGLMLRVTATVLPAPLRPAHHAWLDVLEPQRLWRDLGSQWTLLLAWAPHPLRWADA